MSVGGLIAGFVLDGTGGGREVDWDAIDSWQPSHGVLWVHLDRNDEAACRWVRTQSGLEAITAAALLAEETRPRAFSTAHGLLVILRGVNLNPGANPEDMVSLRMYVDEQRVISVRYRRLMAVSDVVGLLNSNHGPKTTGDLLSVVADRLVARMEPVIDSLGQNADSFETRLAKLTPPGMRSQLRGLRHTAIILRRYLTPQRDIMARLQLEQYEWLSQHNRIELREVADRVTRYIEELDEVRERSALLQDELVNQLTETANRTIYLLTVVAALMLPLSFLTGLLGINVGGIPGTDSPTAFWIVCLLLLVFGLGQVWLFRKLRWI